jgi:hypothetical protein
MTPVRPASFSPTSDERPGEFRPPDPHSFRDPGLVSVHAAPRGDRAQRKPPARRWDPQPERPRPGHTATCELPWHLAGGPLIPACPPVFGSIIDVNLPYEAAGIPESVYDTLI